MEKVYGIISKTADYVLTWKNIQNHITEEKKYFRKIEDVERPVSFFSELAQKIFKANEIDCEAKLKDDKAEILSKDFGRMITMEKS